MKYQIESLIHQDGLNLKYRTQMYRILVISILRIGYSKDLYALEVQFL